MGWAEIKKAINSNLSKSLDILINEKIGNSNPGTADETNVMNYLKKVNHESAQIFSEGRTYVPIMADDSLRYNSASPSATNFVIGKVDGEHAFLGIGNYLYKYLRDDVRYLVSHIAASPYISGQTDLTFDEDFVFLTTSSTVVKLDKNTLVQAAVSSTYSNVRRVICDATHVYMATTTQLVKLNKSDLSQVAVFNLPGNVQPPCLEQDETHVFVGFTQYLYKISKTMMSHTNSHNTGNSNYYFSALVRKDNVLYAAAYTNTNPVTHTVMTFDTSSLTSKVITSLITSTAIITFLTIADDGLFLPVHDGTRYVFTQIHPTTGEVQAQHSYAEINFTGASGYAHQAVLINERLYVYFSQKFTYFDRAYKINGYRRV